MEPISYTLTFERSTKNYHLYRAPAGTLVPDRIYLTHAAAGDMPPLTVEVTVSLPGAWEDAQREAYQRGYTAGTDSEAVNHQ